MERVVAHPRTMIGSDGLPHDRHPHPRLWYAFPRVFARYWRENGVCAYLGGSDEPEVRARAGRKLTRSR